MYAVRFAASEMPGGEDDINRRFIEMYANAKKASSGKQKLRNRSKMSSGSRSLLKDQASYQSFVELKPTPRTTSQGRRGTMTGKPVLMPFSLRVSGKSVGSVGSVASLHYGMSTKVSKVPPERILVWKMRNDACRLPLLITDVSSVFGVRVRRLQSKALVDVAGVEWGFDTLSVRKVTTSYAT